MYIMDLYICSLLDNLYPRENKGIKPLQRRVIQLQQLKKSAASSDHCRCMYGQGAKRQNTRDENKTRLIFFCQNLIALYMTMTREELEEVK